MEDNHITGHLLTAAAVRQRGLIESAGTSLYRLGCAEYFILCVRGANRHDFSTFINTRHRTPINADAILTTTTSTMQATRLAFVHCVLTSKHSVLA